MLRGDGIICGTSSTGTGTLTLSATPGPPGGIDFDVFARATGIGFGNSAAVLVSYTIIEYADSTFATAKATEKGVGTLTLGGSSGIANATLARTTKQTSATSLNSQPATQNIAPGTGISIGTAANTLVFIGASAADVPAFSPYVQLTLGDTKGATPATAGTPNASSNGGGLSNGVHEYISFVWLVPMLVKRVTFDIGVAFIGTTSNCYARIYAVGTDGNPGKLLYDFGLVGSAGSSLKSTGLVSSGAAGSGYFLTPGDYYLDVLHLTTGESTAAQPLIATSVLGQSIYLRSGRCGSSGGLPTTAFAAFTDSATTGPDPAFVTSLTVRSGGTYEYLFMLAAS